MDIGSQRGPVGGTSEVQERRGRGEEEDSCVISGQMQKRQLPRSQGATGQQGTRQVQLPRPCKEKGRVGCRPCSPRPAQGRETRVKPQHGLLRGQTFGHCPLLSRAWGGRLPTPRALAVRSRSAASPRSLLGRTFPSARRAYVVCFCKL